METRLKEAWISALRSGEYKQGKGTLRTAEGKYCCLGVLGEILEKTDEASFTLAENAACYVIRDSVGSGSTTQLPNTLLEKIGLHDLAQEDLIEMNDDQGYSFKQISNWIKEYL
jgi:hypothetical protein